MGSGKGGGAGVALMSRSRARKKRFLSKLAACGVVVEAAEASGVPTGTVYGSWRQTDPDFVAAMDAAVEVGEDVLRSKCVGEVKVRAFDKSNDGMLYFLTKRLDPRFKDNYSVNVGVVSPGSVQIVLAGSEADDA